MCVVCVHFLAKRIKTKSRTSKALRQGSRIPSFDKYTNKLGLSYVKLSMCFTKCCLKQTIQDSHKILIKFKSYDISFIQEKFMEQMLLRWINMIWIGRNWSILDQKIIIRFELNHNDPYLYRPLKQLISTVEKWFHPPRKFASREA